MATFAFALPELGESIESGDVVQLLVSVGDQIAAEQSLLEIETDKAVVEVPSPVSGSVTAIHVAAGDKAAVGQLIVTLETDGGGRGAVAGQRYGNQRCFPANRTAGGGRTGARHAACCGRNAGCRACKSAGAAGAGNPFGRAGRPFGAALGPRNWREHP